MPISVSIVEDDAPVRELLVEWINLAEGFRCLSHYGNTSSAVTQLPGLKPDIVVVDINLPDLNGIECVRSLKPLMPDAQFVMLTVYKDSNHIFDALAAGAVGYLLKQTPCKELIDSLRQVYEGGSPMTSDIARKVVQSFQDRAVSNAPAQGSAVETLSARELQVLELLARGYFYKEICETLAVSKSTVNTHIRHIYSKLHVHTRGKAIAKYTKSMLPKSD
jgi:DNA-binding NarL/FixJ family response regulator